MNTRLKTLTTIIVLSSLVVMTSCDREDPGPLQRSERDFTVVDFDRLEMGSGFQIEVEQSGRFEIKAEGDRRNLDDLEVFTIGGTLIVKYKDNGNRHHETKIKIEMPTLRGINFSGGTKSEIEDFTSDQQLELTLSGGSICQLEAGYRAVNVVLSGGSSLYMQGLGDEIDADVSGASVLTAFDYPVRQAKIRVSGASRGKLTVTDDLNVTASGASGLLYRGSPSLTQDVSGASSVQRD